MILRRQMIARPPRGLLESLLGKSVRELLGERGHRPPLLAPAGVPMGFMRKKSGAAPAMPTFVAAGTALKSTTGGSVSWPAGHTSGQVALLLAHARADEAPTFSAAEGFVETADSPQTTGGTGAGSTRLHVYWCRATSGSMASPSFNDNGQYIVAQILTFAGCVASGNPWDVTAGDVLTSTSTTATIPGDTTTVANCLIVAIVSSSADIDTAEGSGWTNADLSSVTEITDEYTSLGSGGGFAAATGGKATAGAFGATTATLVTSSQQARIMIALRPS